MQSVSDATKYNNITLLARSLLSHEPNLTVFMLKSIVVVVADRPSPCPKRFIKMAEEFQLGLLVFMMIMIWIFLGVAVFIHLKPYLYVGGWLFHGF
jgi:hypothetical protein